MVTAAVLADLEVFEETDRVIEPLPVPEDLLTVSQDALLLAVQLMFDVISIDVVPPSEVGFHVSADEVREAAICDIVIILGVV